MRIKKILIQNFKGVHDPHIVNFVKQLAVLRGPNGFGKTTTYDAIELSLTGQLHRSMEMKHVTNDTKDYYDVPYRNTRNEDVVIKLHLAREDGDERVVVKRLPYNEPQVTTSREIKNKAADWKNVRTYLLPPEKFDNDDYDLMDESSQEELEQWFFNGSPRSLKRLYRLFGYLQQEENTFYLKLSEKDRKDELDHLFDTNKEAATISKMGTRLTLLGGIQRQIEANLATLDVKAPSSQKIDYLRLVPKVKLDFDEIEPFLNVELDNVDERFTAFKSNLEDIEEFVGSFDVREYEKYLLKQKITKLSEEEKFLQYVIVQKMLADDTYHELVKRSNLQKVTRRDSFLKFFILEKFFQPTSLSDMGTIAESYKLFDSYMNGGDKPISLEDKIGLLNTWDKGLTVEEKKSVTEYAEKVQKLKEGLTQIEDTVSELKEFRDGLSASFEKVHKSNPEKKEDKCECPLCGFGWENYRELEAAIAQKTLFFSTYKSEQMKSFEALKREIEKTLIGPLEIKFASFLNTNKRSFNFYGYLQKVKAGLDGVDFISYTRELSRVLPEADSFKWQDFNSSEQLAKDAASLKKLLDSHFTLDDVVIKLLSEIRGYKYEKSIKDLAELNIEGLPTWQTIGTSEKLDADTRKFRQSLVEAASKIEVDVQKIGGSLLHLYKTYFQEDREAVAQARKNIKQKIAYVDWKYQIKKYASFEILKKRSNKLKQIIGSIERTKKIYEEIVKAYKTDLIDAIRVPFYMYSAKIMQNYQQGIGVFLAPSDGTNGSIRFLTEAESDHDVVHHLSSGQLAVVSIAFTLAINKVYGSSSLHFLAIDDPVHELDVLNVHSFVEVLRHDFINQYQLIVSSHDQESAMYMQYRFEKFQPDQVEAIDVQKLFFKTKASR